MKRGALILVLLALGGCATTKRDCEHKWREFDEIRVLDPAESEAQYVVRGRGLHEEFSRVAKAVPGGSCEHHECVGSADIQFLQGGHLVSQWNFGHGMFWAGYELSEESQQGIADWFEGRGLPDFARCLGDTRCGSIFSEPPSTGVGRGQYPPRPRSELSGAVPPDGGFTFDELD